MAGTRPSASALTTAAPSKRRAAATTTKTSTTVQSVRTMSARDRGVWSEEEHDKFLVGIKLFPKGPWKAIAEQVGTRSARQVQTHAQKYYEKVARRLRGLRKDRKKLVRPEHRLDDDMIKLCKVTTYDVASASIGPIGRGVLVHQLPVRAALLPPLGMVDGTDSIVCSSNTNSSAQEYKVEPPSSTVSSPMGVDTVTSAKFDDELEKFSLDHSAADVESQPFALERVVSFLSLLVDDVANDDDNDDCMSTSGSSQSADDVADLAEVDTLVDLDDHYLDFLMDVLETDEQPTYAVTQDDSALCFGFLP